MPLPTKGVSADLARQRKSSTGSPPSCVQSLPFPWEQKRSRIQWESRRLLVAELDSRPSSKLGVAEPVERRPLLAPRADGQSAPPFQARMRKPGGLRLSGDC